MTDADLGDLSWSHLPAFDDRATKRAIRRGIARTAFVGAVWLVLALIVLNMLGAVLLGLTGRTRDLQDVASVAWQVAHPEFQVVDSGVNRGAWNASLFMTVRPIAANVPSTATRFTITESQLGHVGVHGAAPPSLAEGILRFFGGGGGISPPPTTSVAEERSALTGLPKSVVAAAVVEFASPLAPDDYRSFFLAHYKPDPQAFEGGTVLLSDGLPAYTNYNGVVIRGVYGWSPHLLMRDLAPHIDLARDGVRQFQRWVHSLNGSDSGELNRVGVDLKSLRAAAREGRIHGVILSGVSPTLLLGLLDDPVVAAVRTFDVGFKTEESTDRYSFTSPY